LTVSAGELLIAAPKDGQAVKEGIAFTASAKELPDLAIVEWRLNGRTISTLRTGPDFSHPWHPAEVFPGPMTLQAVGRDKNGAEIAVSPVVRFTAAFNVVTAPFDAGTMTLDQPANLDKPLSGVVTFQVTANRPLTAEERKAREEDETVDKTQADWDVKGTVEMFQFFVDGALVARPRGAHTGAIEVDTARLPNGEHELMVGAFAKFTGTPPCGMLQVTFTTDNGRSPMAVLPRWTTLALQPDEAADLTPRLMFTNGDIATLEAVPTYTSADPAIATVDEKGVVKAVAKGLTTITLTVPADKIAGAKGEPFTAEVLVYVGLPKGTPHFTRDGRMRLEYDPERSRFTRSYFSLVPRFIVETPGLAELVKDAGLNTCESGFFHNPADGNGIDSLEKYITHWETWFERNITQPMSELDGFGITFTGDDWVRSGREFTWTATTPWVHDLAKHIWTKMRDSGIVTSIEMMDEASFLGAGPDKGWWTRPEHAEAAKDIQPDALVKFIDAIMSVENHTPITWPVIGHANPEIAANWMGNPRHADYATHFWTKMGGQMAYPWYQSHPQMRADLKRVMVGRFTVIQSDRPQLMLLSSCGPFFKKLVEGDRYQPGLDELHVNSFPASESQSTQPYYAALSGAAGVRTYALDFTWKRNRERNAIGTMRQQTGASPFGEGSDRWHAMSAAFNLIGTLEPYLLQPRANGVAIGPDFDTDARRGKDSNLLMAINWSQRPRTAIVDMSPYAIPGADTIICYRGHGSESSVTLLPLPADGQITMTFQPGEFVALVVKNPKAENHVVPPAVRLTLPREMTVTGPLELSAEANSPAGIKQVEFFVNGKSVGVSEEAPFKATWDGETTLKGQWHGLKAVATDAAGHTSESRAMVRVAP